MGTTMAINAIKLGALAPTIRLYQQMGKHHSYKVVKLTEDIQDFRKEWYNLQEDADYTYNYDFN